MDQIPIGPDSPGHIENDPESDGEETPPSRLPRWLQALRVDLPTAIVLMAMSAWLWWRISGFVGQGAPLIGALIGLATTYLVRHFC